jgi:acyl carrier protein
MREDISVTLKNYILQEFLPGEDPTMLTETTPLMDGILDSIGTLKLVTFLEEQFNLPVELHEIDEKHFKNISALVGLVQMKHGKVG